MADGTVLDVQVDRSGPVVTVYLSGEIDPSTAPRLTEQLGEALTPATRRMVLDLSQVTFCDSTGLRAISVLRERCLAEGATLTLQDPTRNLRRILEVTGLAAVLDVHGTA